MSAASNLRRLSVNRATREAVVWEMEQDENIVMLGQDLFAFGGVFGVAEGLGTRFGAHRIVDTPISETGVLGMAAGMAIAGMRPIVDMAYIDFIGVCFNVLLNYAAKTHYMSGGQFQVPMILLASTGGGYSNAAQHSQCLHGLVAHIPGAKVVCPSTAYDAKGMMHQALRDGNLVVFLAHIATIGLGFLGKVMPTTVSEVPEEPYTVPFGVAKTMREGRDVTLVAIGRSVHDGFAAAEQLEREDGISVEVIDLRSFVPLDREAIFKSVQKTGRLIVVDEDYLSYGVTAEISAAVTDRDPRVLKSPVKRLAFPDVPVPFSRPLERYCLPWPDKILREIRAMLKAG
jgi:acetoin:2,6-dichlorophenolindophenol oxidoreductase subunit beta